MMHPLYPSLNQWCHDNGWTDLFVERYQFWAFPPGGVLPAPLPDAVLEDLHAQHYRGLKYSASYGTLFLASGLAIVLALFSHSPMPLVAAFSISAIAVGLLDDL